MAHRANLARSTALAASGFFFLSCLVPLGCSREADDPPGPATPTRPRLRFAPARLEFLDVAVGETITRRIVLHADTPVDWRDVLLVSSCDCLVVDYAGTSEPTRAEVEVSVIGVTTEAIEGDVFAETPKHEELADFRAPIKISRRPFVQPREIVLAKDAPDRFELFVGQAFSLDAELPSDLVEELDPATFDETKLMLTGFDDIAIERTDTDVILRQRIECTIVEEARPTPFTTELPITFGNPPVSHRIKVTWPGRSPE